MTDPLGPGPRKAPPERSGTVLETDEEIRQSEASGSKDRQPVEPIGPGRVPPPIESIGPPAHPFRPSARPPVAMLTIYDDGKAEGEAIRIRDHRFVIGRTEGDLRIPIDGRISARHAEVTLQLVGGKHRWVVTDLQSLHGMFVRVTRTALADKAEILVGGGRYRFDAPQPATEATADYITEGSASGTTRGWDDNSAPLRPPALTELIGNEIGNRLVLVKPEYWIGTDPACPICRTDDPFCEPRHARLYRGPKGGWSAEHNKTRNGLWLRMAQITVEAMIQFQLGEQRFRLAVQ